MQALSQKYAAQQGSSQAGGPAGSSSSAVSSLLDKMNLQA